MPLKSCCRTISQRWLFAILASAGLCMQTTLSVIMSTAISEMDERIESFEKVNVNNNRSINDLSFVNNKTLLTSQIEDNSTIQRHSSDEYWQEMMVSFFSGSSAVFEILSGTLAERFGGKYLLGLTVFIPAVITFTMPFTTIINGTTTRIIIRAIKELAGDGLFPVITTMIPNWTTLAEKTLMGGVIYSGSILGLFFGNVTPILMIKYFNMTWSDVFYLTGAVGIIWFILWLIFVYENPKIHPFISAEEFKYLQSSLAERKDLKCKLPIVRWKEMFLCKEFWACTIGYVGCHCIFYLMVNGLPKYMSEVIKVESNAYFSSISYILMWFNSILSAWISEKLLEKQWMTQTNVRKCMTTISITLPAVFLLLGSYAECNKTMVVVMFTIGIALMGSMYSSLTMNPLDLSLNHAGSIMSCGCAIALCAEILVLYFINLFTPNSTMTEWRLVFWMIFLVASCSNAVYLLCFKAEVNPWNELTTVRDENEQSIKEMEEADVLEYFNTC